MTFPGLQGARELVGESSGAGHGFSKGLFFGVSRDDHTRSVADSGIKRSTYDADVEWLIWLGQAFHMLEMSKRGNARECPLPQVRYV